MKERVKVMQDVYENRSTNKKAAGCTVIISGEMRRSVLSACGRKMRKRRSINEIR